MLSLVSSTVSFRQALYFTFRSVNDRPLVVPVAVMIPSGRQQQVQYPIPAWGQAHLQPAPHSLSSEQTSPPQVPVPPFFTGPWGPWSTGPWGPWFTGPWGPWSTGPLGPWSTGPSCWALATPGINTANAAPAKALPIILSACPRETLSLANSLAKVSRE